MEDSKNYCVNVYKKISKDERKNWKLYIDAIYKADPNEKTMKAEVISKLLGVKNQGGFRFLGKMSCPKLVVLFTSGKDIYWKDNLDIDTGTLLYYGDNKTPGTELHNTILGGNKILRHIFKLAYSEDIKQRENIPPIFVFKNANGRDVKFMGLAVPGKIGMPKKEWLTAVWGCNINDDRFQNYKSYFTILNTSTGSEFENEEGINLAWLNDIEKGNALQSKYCPTEWKNYILNKKFLTLEAKREKNVKSKENQLPSDEKQLKMLVELQKFFIGKDRGYSFEKFAADILKQMNINISDIEVTRPYKDGGFDAKGNYTIFREAESSVSINFYMQAKCYSINNSIGVKDTSRLISRTKNNQFGILFTTSYIANQAYTEILKDGQSIVIITGKNIIDFLFNELELRDVDKMLEYLKNTY